jgi:hypothetical protein
MSDDAKCPYVVGTTTLHCSLTPFTLTAEEREAIGFALDRLRGTLRGNKECEHAESLRVLLERTK